MLDDTVRRDQLPTARGRLWYDSGDSWGHMVQMEAVLDKLFTMTRCTTRSQACP